jgi:hypothetical protein
LIDAKKDKEYLRRAIEDSALGKKAVESLPDFWDQN